MIPHDKLMAMLRMQDELNKKIHPEWRKQKFAWHRAIMVEGTELLEHIGWKWWKKQTSDLPQARIELVDIWHFGMSALMMRCLSLTEAAESLVSQQRIAQHHRVDMMRSIECLIGAAGNYSAFEAGVFFNLMDHLGMTGDDLYRTYVAKNVLNTFRQDHGYKDGTYIKLWSGLEDNVVLERLMAQLPDATPEQLRTMLEKAYALELATQ